MRLLVSALAIPLYAMLLSCGTASIPKVAVEGTTVTIAIPRDFEVGYGRALFSSPPHPDVVGNDIGNGSFNGPALNSGNLNAEDLQRGELVVRLLDGGTAIATLPVRYVTRAAADPASNQGRVLDTGLSAQKLLLVDIPLTKASGAALVTDGEGQKTFGIEVRRFRRSNLLQSSTNFLEVPQSFFGASDWIGWGHDTSISPVTPIPIQIRDANGLDGGEESTTTSPTPFDGWNAAIVSGFFSGVARLTNINVALAVPDPEFRVELAPPGASLPGAWEVDLTYPSEKMRITGVTLTRPSQSGGFVSYEPDAEVSCSTTTVPGNLQIRVVDPEASATGVKVSYVLKNDVVGCNTTRVLGSEVAVAQTLAYDLDGVLITTMLPSSVVDSDFN